MRAKLFECFPEMQYVASLSFGSVAGKETTADGMGYGPMYKVTRYAMSTAFLVTEGFNDKDSLAARMIQARFTGWYRFGCKAWYEWVADPTNAAAGSNGHPDAQKGNPEDFNSPFDRNLLLIATILFAESYRNELCDLYNEKGCDGYAFGSLDPVQFWKEQCELPAGWRNAIPSHFWSRDPNLYTGTEDMFGHSVEDWEIAPMRTYGSLQQLRDYSKEVLNGAGYAEDFTEYDSRPDSAAVFYTTRLQRSLFNPYWFYKTRLCDPEYLLSIEEMVGNPPFWKRNIRDTSKATLFNSDMIVPARMRGESNFESGDNSPNACPAGGGCDLENKPGWKNSSLLQWVYVTSSHEPGVRPGLYRLVDAPIFPKIPCDQLPKQRCGVQKTLKEHGRSPPSCNFFCSLGRGLAKVASAVIAVAELASLVYAPGSFLLRATLRNALGIQSIQSKVNDALWNYITSPIGDSTYAVNPHSGLGRAALYGVSPLIFGYGGRRMEAIDYPADSNATHSRRKLFTANYKKVQVDWTYDAIYKQSIINENVQQEQFWASTFPTVEFMVGVRAATYTRCVPSFFKNKLPDLGGTVCGSKNPTTKWFAPYADTVGPDGQTRVCYPNEMQIVSSPKYYGALHFLERLYASPPPPLPPPDSPPPLPPNPPNPSPPPAPPLGFTADEMKDKIRVIQAKFCGALLTNQTQRPASVDRARCLWQIRYTLFRPRHAAPTWQPRWPRSTRFAVARSRPRRLRRRPLRRRPCRRRHRAP